MHWPGRCVEGGIQRQRKLEPAAEFQRFFFEIYRIRVRTADEGVDAIVPSLLGQAARQHRTSLQNIDSSYLRLPVENAYRYSTLAARAASEVQVPTASSDTAGSWPPWRSAHPLL